MTTMVTNVIYNERGVLSCSDSNSIVVFKCDGCSEVCKHLTCLASSPNKQYLCDECLHK
jgi:hypothetical protein